MGNTNSVADLLVVLGLQDNATSRLPGLMGKFDMLGISPYDEIDSEFPNKFHKIKFYRDKREEVRD